MMLKFFQKTYNKKILDLQVFETYKADVRYSYSRSIDPETNTVVRYG